MTHKEKAQELVDKFKFDCRIEYECRPLSVNQIAKQCALIAVGEIIDEWNKTSDLKSVLYITDNLVTVVDRICYWQEIKREIKKL